MFQSNVTVILNKFKFVLELIQPLKRKGKTVARRNRNQIGLETIIWL